MANIITIKTFEALEKMRFAGRIAADALSFIHPRLQPGISTQQIDKLLEQFIREKGCEPAFLHYQGYPASSCISINEEVVHCIPSPSRILKNGDIVKIDFGTIYKGYYSDTAKTFIIGDVSPEIRQFVTAGYHGLLEGIKRCTHGTPISVVSNIIFSYISKYGYGIVEQFVGHGIGQHLHEAPQIPNTRSNKPQPILVNGMVICLEPSYTIKPNAKIKVLNGWNAVAEDTFLAGHWEHTIYVSPEGPEILTLTKEERSFLNVDY